LAVLLLDHHDVAVFFRDHGYRDQRRGVAGRTVFPDPRLPLGRYIRRLRHGQDIFRSLSDTAERKTNKNRGCKNRDSLWRRSQIKPHARFPFQPSSAR
jgi:hypothetical protein